jgi:hypothetical protein
MRMATDPDGPSRNPLLGASRESKRYRRSVTDARAAVHAFLLDFVEGRNRSRRSVARLEPSVSELATADSRFEDLEMAFALYDGRQGKSSEPGLLNQDRFAAECRGALHDLDDHRYCQHASG